MMRVKLTRNGAMRRAIIICEYKYRCKLVYIVLIVDILRVHARVTAFVRYIVFIFVKQKNLYNLTNRI